MTILYGWGIPPSSSPLHSEDCSIHGCEGRNGDRFCDCLQECGHFTFRYYYKAEDDYGCLGCDGDLPSDKLLPKSAPPPCSFCSEAKPHTLHTYSDGVYVAILTDTDTRLGELRRMLDQYPGQQGGLQAIAEELYCMARSKEKT